MTANNKKSSSPRGGRVNSLARFVFAHLPCHVRRTVIAAISNWRIRKPHYAGVYSSFADLSTDLPHSNAWTKSWPAYASELAVKSRTKSNDGTGVRAFPPSRLFMPLVAATLQAEHRSVRILDFGGAAGFEFGNLLAVSGLPDVRYHVVDHAELCEAGRQVWSDDPRITFDTELPAAGEIFDLVYAWGAIEYVDDWRALLARFASYNPGLILIFTKIAPTGFVRGNVNNGAPFPGSLFGLSDLTRAFNELGYSLAYRAVGAGE